MLGKKESGDYQTPKNFADEVCRYLKNNLNLSPDFVLEPTCGKGNFIESSFALFPQSVVGIELNPEYADECKIRFNGNSSVKIINENIFTFRTSPLFKNPRQLLVLGNPPWVTNTELSSIESTNLPQKSNFKNLKGLNALTGASNFDICEFIIMRLVDEYKNTNTYFSLICKESVARNVYAELVKKNISFDFFEILEINAKKIFNVNASACVMIFRLSARQNHKEKFVIKNFDSPDLILSQYVSENGKFITSEKKSEFDFEGKCCFEWRQGIKHDCAKIMELDCSDGKLLNGQKEIVEIENSLVYPLMKSSMFKEPVKNSFEKKVLVTQSRINQDTSYIKKTYPETWHYLSANAEFFDNRKSSIYLKSSRFAIFGIGDYSFAKYKVGISGFYKKPFFSLLYTEEKSVMLDDTSYFIGFDFYDDAYTAMLLLNSDCVQSFLESISFKDAKRPYTKKILSRLDFRKIVGKTNFEQIQKTEKKLGLKKYITNELYESFKKSLPQELELF